MLKSKQMKKVKYIIFRYLTSADFFNIYKPSGTEEGGGGQSYIDFPIESISMNEWGKFFDGAASVFCDTGEKGPSWTFPINSIGLLDSQDLKIYQRRPQSVCIAAQKIASKQGNRVNSWKPENGFPEPKDPTERSTVPENLMIFIVRTVDDEFRAGWALDQSPTTQAAESVLTKMLSQSPEEGYAGFLDAKGQISLDTSNANQPFTA